MLVKNPRTHTRESERPFGRASCLFFARNVCRPSIPSVGLFCRANLVAETACSKVTELCTGGELFDRILEKTESEEGRYSERDAMTLVTKILSAIAYCHDEHNICHRCVTVPRGKRQGKEGQGAGGVSTRRGPPLSRAFACVHMAGARLCFAYCKVVWCLKPPRFGVGGGGGVAAETSCVSCCAMAAMPRERQSWRAFFFVLPAGFQQP